MNSEQRNIRIHYKNNPTPNFAKANFYANEVYISIMDENVRDNVELITGEIRVRNKKRRKIELQIPFFDKLNEFIDMENPGYPEFETIINCPILKFEWLGNDTESKLNSSPGGPEINYFPYIPSYLFNDINVILKEKETEFLDDFYDKRIINLILIEATSWYAQ